METFAVGTACCWTGHKFAAGEQAMQCLTCKKVVTESTWEKKLPCRCGSTNFVPAIASHVISPMRLRNSELSSDLPRQPRTKINWETLRSPTQVPPSYPRRQLNWRDPSPPTIPLRPRQTRRSRELRWRDPKPPSLQEWQVILISCIGGFLVFVAIALLSQ